MKRVTLLLLLLGGCQTGAYEYTSACIAAMTAANEVDPPPEMLADFARLEQAADRECDAEDDFPRRAMIVRDLEVQMREMDR